jgi:hypothetical protein
MWSAALPPVHVDSSPLDPGDCLSLLEQCESASLACTVRAMPTVVPVTVRVVQDTLRVALPTAADAARLVGQIVALGAAVPATPRSEGWWVIVRGELVRAPGDGRVLALNALEVEGRALAPAPRGRWWRC